MLVVVPVVEFRLVDGTRFGVDVEEPCGHRELDPPVGDEDLPDRMPGPAASSASGVGRRPRDGEPSRGPKAGTETQSTGAAIGLTPARSSRLTRIVISVMISASSMIPAATMYPLEKPVDRAWLVAAFCSAAAWAADRCTVAVLAAAAAAAACACRLFATALHATVPSTARPSAPPTCWPVLSRLEATPASVLATLVSAISESGTKISPMPAAVTIIGPSRPPT